MVGWGDRPYDGERRKGEAVNQREKGSYAEQKLVFGVGISAGNMCGGACNRWRRKIYIENGHRWCAEMGRWGLSGHVEPAGEVGSRGRRFKRRFRPKGCDDAYALCGSVLKQAADSRLGS